jgi:hypothetical protein
MGSTSTRKVCKYDGLPFMATRHTKPARTSNSKKTPLHFRYYQEAEPARLAIKTQQANTEKN